MELLHKGSTSCYSPAEVAKHRSLFPVKFSVGQPSSEDGPLHDISHPVNYDISHPVVSG